MSMCSDVARSREQRAIIYVVHQSDIFTTGEYFIIVMSLRVRTSHVAPRHRVAELATI